MAVLGTIVLVFIVTHMQNFWWRMHFDAEMPKQLLNGVEINDLHTVVMDFFDPGVNDLAAAAAGLYVLGMFALGFHLWHGFASAFQSMGLRHEGYTPLIEKVGKAFAVVVPAAFASIPLYLFLTQA